MPTVFNEDEELDLHGQRRVIDFLVDAKADGACVLANYSEQFSLTDEERDQVLRTTLEHAAGRIPVCVTTSHYSARIARQRTLAAQREGAAMAMLMAPFFGTTVRVDEDGVVEYFKRVTDGLAIDLMSQDAPMSPTPLPVGLLARLAAEIPQVRYVKIEMPQTADKLRALAAAAGGALPGLFDGEEAITLIPTWKPARERRGRLGGDPAPDPLREPPMRPPRHQGPDEGRPHHQQRQDQGPLGGLHPDTRAQLLEIAKRKDPLILHWA
ncbi:dihydrodipicolinate synthase family protein [Sinomonas terrae]|uniref:Dihydrodipicolinate synthase family protein n=1 Tax=Sinomonas terrae TaxID=2908838 RepID=A0ABS9U5W9_9MICC|nr:dihydrodipicolinate synthase family protein [Sinomonas terrae]MCH6472081.1 dihydrodipicolinate synthase family protein [Sinomonas terrae]